MFLVYVNDIVNCVPDDVIRLFADDTNIFVTSDNFSELYEKANHILEKIREWFYNNKLTLNLDKTCYTLFSRAKIKEIYEIKCGNQNVSKVSSVKYLGVNVDENLNWKEHVNSVCLKLKRLKCAISYLSQFTNASHVSRIYNAYIYPHIQYGIEIYGSCSSKILKPLQILQNKLLKTLCHKKQRDSATVTLNENNILSCRKLNEYFVALFVFKQQNSMLPEVFSNYFRKNSDVHTAGTRQSNNLYIINPRTSSGQRNLKYLGAKIWNNLPQNCRNATRISEFKRNLKLSMLCQ